MKHYFPTPLVLALAADAAFADWFNDWDTNRDNRLSEEDFGAGYAPDGVYDDWGVDGDDSLRMNSAGACMKAGTLITTAILPMMSGTPAGLMSKPRGVG